MTQSQLLDSTMQLLVDKGAESAYSFIKRNYEKCEDPCDARVYQLRCTLAIQSGQIDEGLEIMNEAVMTRELWFRPEFFDDEVLAPVWKTETYKQCRHRSDRLYTEARQKAKTFCTWDRVRDQRIMLALHGNGQSIQDSKQLWQFAEEFGWQTEYIQSKELDFVGKYRWNDNSSAPYQLETICGQVGWHDYDERALVGYGSGCNVILRALNGGMLECEKIILVSPHIPVIESDEENIFKMLLNADSQLLVFCCKGRDNTSAVKLVRDAIGHGVAAKLIEAEGSGVPNNFPELVKPYL